MRDAFDGLLSFVLFIGLIIGVFLLNFIFYGGVIALIAYAIYFLVKALGLV